MDNKQAPEKRFALLIDADNVSAKYIKPITDELSKYGTVTIKRIYGDWTLTLHAKWKDALLENSITPIQQFGYTQGKNATDSAMIIDAMDILYGGSVDGFCIVSSDSDFTRLAARIRESGLTVVGMGEKKTPVPFRKACDIFTTLELLLNDSRGGGRGRKGQGAPDTAGTQDDGPAFEDIEQAVVNIITDNQNNGKSTGLGEVGSRLLKRYPDFDVRSYGTNLLSKLLNDFASVQITKDGSNVSVELTDAAVQAEDDGAAAKEQRGPKKKNGRNRPGKRHRAAQAAAEAREEAPLQDEAAEQPEGAEAAPADQRAQGEAAQQPVAAEPLQQAAEAGQDDGSEAKPKAKRRRKPQGKKRPAAGSPAEDASESAGSTPAEPEAAPAGDAVQAEPAPQPATGAPQRLPEVEAFIRQQVAESGAEGVALSDLGKAVRGKFRTFKLRDLGYSQFKSYVADLGDIEIERIGKDSFARIGE